MSTRKGRPPATSGMRHVALNVVNMAATEHFYVELLGMQVEWRPDEDNVYLTSGNDNLALHRVEEKPSGQQHLDHIGFIIPEIDQVGNRGFRRALFLAGSCEISTAHNGIYRTAMQMPSALHRCCITTLYKISNSLTMMKISKSKAISNFCNPKKHLTASVLLKSLTLKPL